MREREQMSTRLWWGMLEDPRKRGGTRQGCRARWVWVGRKNKMNNKIKSKRSAWIIKSRRYGVRCLRRNVQNFAQCR